MPVAAAGQVLTVFARTITVVSSTRRIKQRKKHGFALSIFCCLRAWRAGTARCYSGTDCLAFVSADMVSNMLSAIPEFVTLDCRLLAVLSWWSVTPWCFADGREIFDAFLFPRFPRRWLPDLSLLAFGGVGVIMALLYIR